MDLENKQYSVYQHKNKINGKVYIGITSTSLEKRAGLNGNNYSKNTLFYRAIQKYGWDNFEHTIMYTGLGYHEAAEKEKDLIRAFHSTDPLFGYNLSSGGESGNAGCHMSSELKAIHSAAMSGRNNPFWGCFGELHPAFGRRHSEETKEKIGAAHRGKIVSDSTKKKQSEYRKSVLSWSGESNPMYGKTGDKAPQSRAVRCIETGEVFSCIKYAAESKGLFGTRISACCRGKSNTTGGYHWEYVD